MKRQASPLSGNDGTKVVFVEPGDAQETEYAVSFHVKAPQTAGIKAELAVPNQAASLTIGDSVIPLDTNAKHTIEVLDEPVANRILKDWHERTLEQAVEGAADQSICLAKISLLQIGSNVYDREGRPRSV